MVRVAPFFDSRCRWCPVLNAAKFGSRQLLKCRAVITLPKYDSARLAGYNVNFAPGKIQYRGKNPENVYVVYQRRRRTNIVQS